MLSGKNIETIAGLLEPALAKASKRFNNFYPDNSDL